MVRCANFVALVPIPLSETVRQGACVSDDDGRAAQSVQKKTRVLHLLAAIGSKLYLFCFCWLHKNPVPTQWEG